jgi:hypothetical protein
LLDAVEKGDGRGTPIGEALLLNPLSKEQVLPLIDGREAALPEGTRNVDALLVEAQQVGPAMMRLACQICEADASDNLLEAAGTGFELMRLAPAGADDVAARALEKLSDATSAFNKLPRQQRKALLPVFLPIGLARRQAARFPKQRSLLFYQLVLLKMAISGQL